MTGLTDLFPDEVKRVEEALKRKEGNVTGSELTLLLKVVGYVENRVPGAFSSLKNLEERITQEKARYALAKQRYERAWRISVWCECGGYAGDLEDVKENYQETLYCAACNSPVETKKAKTGTLKEAHPERYEMRKTKYEEIKMKLARLNSEKRTVAQKILRELRCVPVAKTPKDVTALFSDGTYVDMKGNVKGDNPASLGFLLEELSNENLEVVTLLKGALLSEATSLEKRLEI